WSTSRDARSNRSTNAPSSPATDVPRSSRRAFRELLASSLRRRTTAYRHPTPASAASPRAPSDAPKTAALPMAQPIRATIPQPMPHPATRIAMRIFLSALFAPRTHSSNELDMISSSRLAAGRSRRKDDLTARAGVPSVKHETFLLALGVAAGG